MTARRKAEKEPIHVYAGPPSSPAPVVTPAVDLVVQAPQDAGEHESEEEVSDGNNGEPRIRRVDPGGIRGKIKHKLSETYPDQLRIVRYDDQNTNEPSSAITHPPRHDAVRRYVATEVKLGRYVATEALPNADMTLVHAFRLPFDAISSRP
ncbi:hypothetical protein Bca52824_048037 [Brassica carinata]|uniref:Uncharacterized protein n=1 Tax=Brassica carinata TaxID=52824 RepID=A0A8X7RI82_BRACI|nr:hypothetical protein Bca52824_048037 [Brassica carinata]